MALNRKRRVFIEEYLKCWNATEAARVAGYKHPDRQGSRLLSFPDVASYLDSRLTEMQVEPVNIPNKPIRLNAKFVYFIRESHGLVKIGKTVDIRRRISSLSSILPYNIEPILVIETPKADLLETYLHQFFIDKRVKGEWFDLSENDIEVVKAKWETLQENDGLG